MRVWDQGSLKIWYWTRMNYKKLLRHMGLEFPWKNSWTGLLLKVKVQIWDPTISARALKKSTKKIKIKLNLKGQLVLFDKQPLILNKINYYILETKKRQ